MSDGPFTVVAFHAHPDDEALLSAGSLAMASAAGHRVVLVVATAGEAGLADRGLATGGLGEHRVAELRRSAEAIGCARLEVFGYPDSGSEAQATAGRTAFADLPVDEPATRLADLLTAERADLLIIDDAAGGYGHRDHRQVYRVGRRAAELARTPVVLEATVDADLLRRGIRLLGWLPGLAPKVPFPDTGTCYTPRAALTHRVDVRRYLARKRLALLAHASQASADGADRTLAFLLRLPGPVFRLVFRYEWFVEQGRRPGPRPLTDLFASLRPTP